MLQRADQSLSLLMKTEEIVLEIEKMNLILTNIKK